MNNLTSSISDLTKFDPAQLSARDRILRTAMILFNENGVHTTGIDKIIAESRVAKMSFYKHFPSKSKLIAAYLSEKGRLRFDRIKVHTIEKHRDPKKQLLGIFDALEEWISEPDFNGCPFIKGLTDFGNDAGSEPQVAVAEYFSKFEAFILERINECLPESKAKVALPLVMSLVVGTIVMGLASKDPKIALANKKAAVAILKGA